MQKNKQYWENELSNWATPLKDLLKSNYMEKLLNFLSMEYALKDIVPSKKMLFKRFKDCDFNNVFIVILVPTATTLTNTRAIIYNKKIYDYANSPLIVIHKRLEQEYDKLILDDYIDLEKWSKQGVLILPMSLTGTKKGVHYKKQWNKFVQYVLNMLNERKKGLIFLQWGTDIKLNKHHHVIKYESPVKAFVQNRDWLFSFKEVDELTMKLNNIKIEW